MLHRQKNGFRCVLLGIALLFWLGGRCSAEDQLPPEGKVASINGMEMYYEIHGQGEPLVLLHGFSGSGSLWSPQIPELAKHYQLVIPDLRGHGRSTNPSGSSPIGSRPKMSLHSWTRSRSRSSVRWGLVRAE